MGGGGRQSRHAREKIKFSEERVFCRPKNSQGTPSGETDFADPCRHRAVTVSSLQCDQDPRAATEEARAGR